MITQSDTAPNTERESRRFWAVQAGKVHNVTGWSCKPTCSDYWWVPSLGYSLQEKHHLFDTEKDALDALIKELGEEADEIRQLLRAAKKRREHLS